MSHTKTFQPSIPLRKHLSRGEGRRLLVRKVLRTAAEGILLAIAISVAVQLAYPRSMALPQTRIGGKSYGFRSSLQIAADIARLHEQKLRISSGEQTLEYTPQELGITFTGMEDAEQAVSYGWRERLTPFSFFLERREVPHYGFTVDESKAREFAAMLKQYDKAPVDATVRLEGTNVVIIKQQDGYAYDTDLLVATIKDLKLTNSLSTELHPKVVQPDITDLTAMEAGGILQQRLQKPLTVQASGKSVTADAALLASWTVLTPDAQNKKLHITYDKEKVKQWLAHFANQVYVPGQPRTVTLLDGAVTGGTDAADGRALNLDATADTLIAAATANQDAIEGTMQPVIVPARTIRNYSRSSQGLQALFNYWDESNGGTWGIVLKDFSGNISASINPNRQFTSASVYKIYIAYVVYTKVDAGEFGMSSPAGNGNSIAGCLELMIVRSDNGCGNALGNKIGWSANNGMLHAKGFTSTSIAYGGQLTTAQDTTTYLMQLQNGGLVSAGHRDSLLNMMGRNIYRYAIPAGSPGMHSANKLGVVGNFSHDVAIVYHPKGAYVLSVLSYGSSHARIRELARQVTAIMHQ